MSAQHYTPASVKQWYQSNEQPIFLGDVLDDSNSTSMGAGFAQYDKGASNIWVVTYDEVLIIIKGVFSVKTATGTATARAGEIIFLTKGTELTYIAEEESELVYVSYPKWATAQQNSQHANLLDTFHPISSLSR